MSETHLFFFSATAKKRYVQHQPTTQTHARTRNTTNTTHTRHTPPQERQHGTDKTTHTQTPGKQEHTANHTHARTQADHTRRAERERERERESREKAGTKQSSSRAQNVMPCLEHTPFGQTVPHRSVMCAKAFHKAHARQETAHIKTASPRITHHWGNVTLCHGQLCHRRLSGRQRTKCLQNHAAFGSAFGAYQCFHAANNASLLLMRSTKQKRHLNPIRLEYGRNSLQQRFNKQHAAHDHANEEKT